MLKVIQLFALSFLLSSSVSGQPVEFEVVGKVNLLKSGSYSSVSEFNATRLEVINDSMLLRTRGTAQITNLQSYSPKLGYEIHGRVAIALSDRIRIRTGLGLNYTAFSRRSETGSYEWTATSIDTVERSTNPGSPTGWINPCDVYDNSTSDLGEINRDIQHTIVNLIIPLELGYVIIPHKLRTHVGILFQTPVYTNTRRESIKQKMEVVNGETRCSFEHSVDENKSGDGFNNLQLGLSASVQYEFFKGIGVEVGVSSALSSIFSGVQYQSSFSGNGVYKPFALTAGISYRFGSHIKPESSN